MERVKYFWKEGEAFIPLEEEKFYNRLIDSKLADGSYEELVVENDGRVIVVANNSDLKDIDFEGIWNV